MFDSDRLFTFLKPAHTWNRQASLKHAIEQNDESPRGHPGHSTMARPSGPNAGSAHVLHASQNCKNRKRRDPKKAQAPSIWSGLSRRIPAPPVPADRPDIALDFLANAVGRNIPRLELGRDVEISTGVRDIFVTHVEAVGAEK